MDVLDVEHDPDAPKPEAGTRQAELERRCAQEEDIPLSDRQGVEDRPRGIDVPGDEPGDGMRRGIRPETFDDEAILPPSE